MHFYHGSPIGGLNELKPFLSEHGKPYIYFSSSPIVALLYAVKPGDHDIFEIHDLIDCIERELNEKLFCEAVIHMDPIETNNEEVTRMRKLIEQKVKTIDERMTIHDFRMVTGNTHTNLIFDAVAPYGLKMSMEELKKRIEELVQELEGNYFAIVHIDQSYV